MDTILTLDYYIPLAIKNDRIDITTFLDLKSMNPSEGMRDLEDLLTSNNASSDGCP